jgi:4-hydroxymandelate oxidase
MQEPIAASPPPANLEEWEALAKQRLPQMVYDYYAGGAGDEAAVRANRWAFQCLGLRPRVLVDVSCIDTSIELFGDRLAHPVLLAPTAFQRLADRDGEVATARAARETGTLLVASTMSTCAIEEIAAHAGPLWFQLYVFRDRGLTRALIERAEAAGARALCLTVTVPVQGNRERDARNHFRLPPELEMANFRGLRQAGLPAGAGSELEGYIARDFDSTLSWSIVEWLRATTRLPLLLKGVMLAEDARLALEHGVDGVIVSNHGGRQLDVAEPTARALPYVAEAIDRRIPVLMDGGVRSGSDVVKALALGARAVMIGRPYLWGLAVAGQSGVESVLRHLREELERTLALVGATSLAQVGRDRLCEMPQPLWGGSR